MPETLKEIQEKLEQHGYPTWLIKLIIACLAEDPKKRPSILEVLRFNENVFMPLVEVYMLNDEDLHKKIMQ